MFKELRLLSHPRDFLDLRNSADLKITEVYLVAPKHFNGTGQWNMSLLREIWVGRSPGELTSEVFIYVASDGARYIDGRAQVAEEELHDLRQLYTAI